MILHSSQFDAGQFERETGWQIKPEGACKGDVCIPLPAAARKDSISIAKAMGLPVVVDEDHGLISIGPESIGAKALTTAQAPDLVLPDLDGRPFALSSLLGQKVLVYAWAPY